MMVRDRDDGSERPDSVDWLLLEHLQDDARLSFAELGRRLGLSPPAVAERLRRLEQSGLVTGYGARVDRARAGYPLSAFVRLRTSHGNDAAVEEWARSRPEVVECHQVTGEESYLLRLCASSVRHLDALLSHLGTFGPTTSTLVLRSPVEGKRLAMPADTSCPDRRSAG
ncbi:MAG TPA: Lrp/AsnC family transcriptional regulator [Arenibaculum sp.]|nr:Lrp/AsnC family transcriptional regulator [Arenibaculum sp.]